MTQPSIAALYVETDGAYFGLNGVDPWDETRDARQYAGPYPVVAHPPCQRWGKMWFGQPLTVKRTGIRKVKGDDGGCFAAALRAVRTYGGVLEHPWGSHAWAHSSASTRPLGLVAGLRLTSAGAGRAVWSRGATATMPASRRCSTPLAPTFQSYCGGTRKPALTL